jgi:hypothetical protein
MKTVIRRSSRRLHLPVALVLSVLAMLTTSSARAAEKETIRPLLRPGLSFDFAMTMETLMEMQAAGGQQQTMNSVVRLEGSLTYKAVEGGQATAAEVSISDKSSISQIINGQKQDAPFPLAGKKIGVKRGENGQIVQDGGDAVNPAMAEGLKKLLNIDTTVYPADAVAVGDEWSPDPAKLPPEITMNGKAKVDLKCKLLKIGELRGRPTYDVSLAGTVVGQPQPGTDMTMTMGGVTQIDKATGLPAQSDMVMKATMKGQQPMEIQMKVSAAYTFGNNAGPGPAPGPAVGGPGVNPLDPRPANPLDPQPANPLDPRPQNPLAPQQPAAVVSPFQGIFKNEKVTAEFKVAGDKVTGAITLANHQYPLVGTVQDGKVAGEFEAGGAKFNFTAALNGDTLDFNSEGNKYTLKKDAPARPRNPLEQ